MTTTKGLLLGSAAGIVAVAGAQAADAPVKAKPLEYVKVCNLYGEGFYYISGTEVCLKVGGYIRSDYGYHVNGARSPQYSGADGRHTRDTSEFSTRHRFSISIDSRTQTAYGTLRTFGNFTVQNENEGDTFNVPRAFIQWAGFTFGRSQSFTDSVAIGEGGVGSLHFLQNTSDTGANGTNQIAYTWELGNGMTLTVGADERRVKSLFNLSSTVASAGANPASSRGGDFNPNPFVAFKVNQAWGRASVAAIASRNNATYLTAAPGAAGYVPTVSCTVQPGTAFCGHPEDRWGWAILSGVMFNTPFIAPKDALYVTFNYGQGAVSYSGGSNLATPGLFGSGNTVALGLVTDAVYVNGASLELTTAWTAAAGFQHWWTNNVMTAAYGLYTQVNYNDAVIGNAWFCGSHGGVNQNIRVPTGASCDPSFKYWSAGIVQNWYPVAGLRLAVDVMYMQVDTAFEGPVSLNGGIASRPTGGYTAKNLGIASVIFRANRSFPAAD
jgi:hypothetical protein